MSGADINKNAFFIYRQTYGNPSIVLYNCTKEQGYVGGEILANAMYADIAEGNDRLPYVAYVKG
ncbi:MAG: hypothetical protein K6T75_10100, partial [Acetobacteraceae bacterium]|nr:hypothetical protein [Acetobacteraceae bacterium]